MRPLLPLLVLLSSSCVVHAHHPAPVPPPPPVVVQVGVFDAHLTPYGSWVVVPTYGRVWSPALAYVGPDFYPYGTGGSWRYTDMGWVFESDYPFGWAVFHYGRWYFDPQLGWLWVPGDTWGPSWVMWRTGGVYVGWAPLGPAGAPPFHHHHWCFVDAHRFREHDVRRHHVPEGNFHAAVAVTAPVPGAAHVGPPPAWLSETTRQPPVAPVPVQQLPGSGRVPPPPPRDATPPPPPREGTLPPPPRDGALPPPPRDGTPPPPRADQPPARLEPDRQVPLPPPREPARLEPERQVPLPPPARAEPPRPPPARLEPERQVPLPPPARVEPPRPITPTPPPARVEPPRPSPPPPARIERGPTLPGPATPGAPPPPPQKKDKVVPLPPKGKVRPPPGP